MPLYARHGIQEAGIVDLRAKRIEIYREASPDGYQRKLELGPNDAITPQSLPEVRVEWERVFG